MFIYPPKTPKTLNFLSCIFSVFGIFGGKKINWQSVIDRTDPQGKQFFNEVNSVLLEWIVGYEAEQFSITSVTEENLKSSKTSLEKKLTALPPWRQLRASNSEIEKSLKRKLMAKQFIRFKVDSSYVPVTDVEVEEFFRKNQNQFAGASLTQKKEEIKSLLGRQKVEQRLQEWFEVLQKKYKVRNFVATT